MSRFYVLTESNGLAIVDATAVDEMNPFTIRFVGGPTVASFDHHDLLWWSPVESTPPAPFSNFSQWHRAQPHFGGAHVGLQLPPSMPRQARRRTDYARSSNAAMRLVVAQVAARVPHDWKAAVLEIKVSYDLAASRYSLVHRLHNAESGAEHIDFSDALFAAIEVFHRIAVEAGENWNQSTITIRFDDQGRCSAEANYGYGTDFSSR
jgi:hypothetical protein